MRLRDQPRNERTQLRSFHALKVRPTNVLPVINLNQFYLCSVLGRAVLVAVTSGPIAKLTSRQQCKLAFPTIEFNNNRSDDIKPVTLVVSNRIQAAIRQDKSENKISD